MYAHHDRWVRSDVFMRDRSVTDMGIPVPQGMTFRWTEGYQPTAISARGIGVERVPCRPRQVPSVGSRNSPNFPVSTCFIGQAGVFGPNVRLFEAVTYISLARFGIEPVALHRKARSGRSFRAAFPPVPDTPVSSVSNSTVCDGGATI